MPKRGIRILVVSDLPPYVIGGAERQVALLVEQWVCAGNSVIVAGRRIPTGTQALGTVHVRTRRVPVVGRFGRLIRGASFMISLARVAYTLRKEIDVVYCRGMGDGLLTLVLLKALRVISWPIVACPINVGGQGDAAFIRSAPGAEVWTRLIDQHCDAINLIARGFVTDLRRLGISKPRITQIPNGVIVRTPPQRRHIPARRRLVWTGRMTPQKGLDLLLPALSQVRQHGYEFYLELIGDGPESRRLQSMAYDLKLSPYIAFFGSLGSEAIRSRLLQADVFVLPSRYEGMSNSALEAMEAGLPVLCTKCGGIDEYVSRGAGWVCKPGSLSELTDSLIEMFSISEAKLLQIGKRAREMAEREFRLIDVAAANLALLRSLTDGRSTSDARF